MGSGTMAGGYDGWAGASLVGGLGGGAQGAQGFQGAAGAQGFQGGIGAQGATGTGSQGAQGAAGAQGFQGGAGAQGAQGSVGAQAGLNIDGTALAGGTLATIQTGFLQELAGNVITGPQTVFTKSRGTLGTPLIVTNADYGGSTLYEMYDGSTMLKTVITGSSITPGATIAAGNVPTDWYVDVLATGVNADPKSVGGSGYNIPFRIIAGVGTNASFGNDHYGTVLINGPASFTEAMTQVDGGAFHETANLNTFGTLSQEWHSFSLLHWRPDNTNTWVPNGGLSWSLSNAVSGSWESFFEVTGLYHSVTQTESLFSCFAVAGSGGHNSHGSLRTSFEFSFYPIQSNTIWQQQGAGPTYYDLIISRDGANRGTTAGFKFQEDSTGGNALWINQGPGGQQASIRIGGNSAQGIYWDPVNGSMWTNTPNTSFCVGPGLVYANSRTFDFLGLPTMAGPPTGQPVNMQTGKSALVYDTTNRGAWHNRTASTTWDFSPTVAAGVLGAFVGIRTAILSDGAGGSFTVISST